MPSVQLPIGGADGTRFSEVLDIDIFPGTRFMRKAVCKLCGEKIYEVGRHALQAEIGREFVGLILHLELSHNFIVSWHRCSNTECGKTH